ncbi:Retrotransposon Polyprotein [Phytophthora megakarya]|uniref:Retrotransposon Polyprotein n=1 Tax=Phytophthora megakarya TaxID=4795 RepID=A0A225VEE0_9STRA|nr:Retrotransposon Polyprotein [Phytophthora megakarya]
MLSLFDNRWRKVTIKCSSQQPAEKTYHWMGLSGMFGIWSRIMRLLFGRFTFIVAHEDDLRIVSQTVTIPARYLMYFAWNACLHSPVNVCSERRRLTPLVTQPPKIKQLQSFLGLAGNYRRFIYVFVQIVLSLSELVKKTASWSWNQEQKRAFLQLKIHLQQAPVLRLHEAFVVTTDASCRPCGGVLSQQVEGHDFPVAFFSKKLLVAELSCWTR